MLWVVYGSCKAFQSLELDPESLPEVLIQALPCTMGRTEAQNGGYTELPGTELESLEATVGT